MGRLAIAAIFTIQVIGILSARFQPTRYLSWAPYDQICEYTLSVRIGGVELSDREVGQRYRIPAEGRENRAVSHLIGAIEQFEGSYGQADHSFVKLEYSVNGRRFEAWEKQY